MTNHRQLLILGKWLLIVALCWALYAQLGTQSKHWDAQLVPLIRSNWPVLAGVLALMPLNWLFEVLKWRSLLGKDKGQFISTLKITKAVAAGIAFSQLTPNRIGEYGGRALLMPPGRRWETVGATLLGSMAQWVALLSGGVAGLVYWAARYWHWSTPMLWQVGAVASVAICLLCIAYFFSGSFIQRLPDTPYSRWLTNLANWSELDDAALGKALAWAFARYAVYVAQYVLLLYVFVPDLHWGIATAGVALVFLFQTGLPVPPPAAALARSEIALWVWAPFTTETLPLVAASWLLFIINIGIPALLGTVAIVENSVFQPAKGHTHEPVAKEQKQLTAPK